MQDATAGCEPLEGRRLRGKNHVREGWLGTRTKCVTRLRGANYVRWKAGAQTVCDDRLWSANHVRWSAAGRKPRVRPGCGARNACTALLRDANCLRRWAAGAISLRARLRAGNRILLLAPEREPHALPSCGGRTAYAVLLRGSNRILRSAAGRELHLAHSCGVGTTCEARLQGEKVVRPRCWFLLPRQQLPP